MLGLVTAVGEPVLAQAAGVEPMGQYGQLGVCGLLGGIVLALVLRTIPAQAKSFGEAIKEAATTTATSMNEIKTEVHGLRSDVQRGTESQLELLTDMLKDKRD